MQNQSKTEHTPDLMYVVKRNPFHARYAGEEIYRGRSLARAIRAARKEDCRDCTCGGPRLAAEHDNGDHIALAQGWEAARPFIPANNIMWDTGYTPEQLLSRKIQEWK